MDEQVGVVLVEKLDVLGCMKSDVTWIWDTTAVCTWVEERSDAGPWGLLNGASGTLFKFTDLPASGI